MAPPSRSDRRPHAQPQRLQGRWPPVRASYADHPRPQALPQPPRPRRLLESLPVSPPGVPTVGLPRLFDDFVMSVSFKPLSQNGASRMHGHHRLPLLVACPANPARTIPLTPQMMHSDMLPMPKGRGFSGYVCPNGLRSR